MWTHDKEAKAGDFETSLVYNECSRPARTLSQK